MYKNCPYCGEEMEGMSHECPEGKLAQSEASELRDGEPCSRPGCLSHITHPCEGCGRIGGISKKGLFKKYVIHKADGSPIDPDAVYFVLRLDTDPHAVEAAHTYAASVMGENDELANDLRYILIHKSWDALKSRGNLSDM